MNLPKQMAKLLILRQLMWLISNSCRNELWQDDLKFIQDGISQVNAKKSLSKNQMIWLNTTYTHYLSSFPK